MSAVSTFTNASVSAIGAGSTVTNVSMLAIVKGGSN